MSVNSGLDPNAFQNALYATSFVVSLVGLTLIPRAYNEVKEYFRLRREYVKTARELTPQQATVRSTYERFQGLKSKLESNIIGRFGYNDATNTARNVE